MKRTCKVKQRTHTLQPVMCFTIDGHGLGWVNKYGPMSIYVFYNITYTIVSAEQFAQIKYEISIRLRNWE